MEHICPVMQSKLEEPSFRVIHSVVFVRVTWRETPQELGYACDTQHSSPDAAVPFKMR